jgi:hypothetical protein
VARFATGKRTLFDYPLSGILTNHEGTRRKVHGFSCPAAFHLIISWMRHSLLGEQRTRYVACIPKGYGTMLAIHDQFTHQTSDRLKTTCIGLGLVRLLQDAKRFEEAKATLYSLEGVGAGKPKRRLSKRIPRSRSSGSIRIEAACSWHNHQDSSDTSNVLMSPSA